MNEKTVDQILRLISNLDAKSALELLNKTAANILKQENDDSLNGPAITTRGPKIIKHPHMISKVERDPEVKAFIHNYPEPINKTDLRKLLIEKFGNSRAPSRSGLSRYLLKVKRGL